MLPYLMRVPFTAAQLNKYSSMVSDPLALATAITRFNTYSMQAQCCRSAVG